MSGLFNHSGKISEPTGATTPGMVDARLLAFVEQAEGFSAHAFADYHQYSIGYGTRAKSPDEVITRDEAAQRLTTELGISALAIDKATAQSGLVLNANQRDALISFDFNTGEGAYLVGTSHSIEEIAARLPTWNKVTIDGRKVADLGLTHRRTAELALFNGSANNGASRE